MWQHYTFFPLSIFYLTKKRKSFIFISSHTTTSEWNKKMRNERKILWEILLVMFFFLLPHFHDVKERNFFSHTLAQVFSPRNRLMNLIPSLKYFSCYHFLLMCSWRCVYHKKSRLKKVQTCASVWDFRISGYISEVATQLKIF
jgi:hypothetical protein